jgi:hypothetical protein
MVEHCLQPGVEQRSDICERSTAIFSNWVHFPFCWNRNVVVEAAAAATAADGKRSRII